MTDFDVAVAELEQIQKIVTLTEELKKRLLGFCEYGYNAHLEKSGDEFWIVISNNNKELIRTSLFKVYEEEDK